MTRNIIRHPGAGTLETEKMREDLVGLEVGGHQYEADPEQADATLVARSPRPGWKWR